jgi:predicted Fe-Mo cluster-binding NifX family protein
MASSIRVSHPSASRIAIAVMKSETSHALCPFFGKCDGIWIVDADSGATEFHANPQRTPAALCDLILSARPARLICGFIGDAEKRRLRAAGIDVRLGSCVSTVEDLVASFQDLAAA